MTLFLFSWKDKMTERPCRSSAYQYKIVEHQMDFSEGIATSWDQSRALYPDSIYNEEQAKLDTLNLKAYDRMIELAMAPGIMTEKQMFVFKMMLENPDISQVEMQKIHNKHYKNTQKNKNTNTNIFKIIKGAEFYGGLNKKIMKICLRDEVYRQCILTLYQEEYGSLLRLTKSWFNSHEDFIIWITEERHPEFDATISAIELADNIIIDYYLSNSLKITKAPSKTIWDLIKNKTPIQSFNTFEKIYKDQYQYIYTILKEQKEIKSSSCEAVKVPQKIIDDISLNKLIIKKKKPLTTIQLFRKTMEEIKIKHQNINNALNDQPLILEPIKEVQPKRRYRSYTNKQIREMMEMKNNGISIRAISRYFDTSHSAITQALKNYTIISTKSAT